MAGNVPQKIPKLIGAIAAPRASYAPAWNAGEVADLALDTTTGRLLVDVPTLGAANGAAVSGNPTLIAGYDGTTTRTVQTDANGALRTLPYIKATTYGTTLYRSVAITNTDTLVKGSSGTIFSIAITNLHSADIFLKFFSLNGSVTPGTTTPQNVFQVTANKQLIMRGADLPWFFAQAIHCFATTVGTDTGAQTAPGALPIVELEYA